MRTRKNPGSSTRSCDKDARTPASSSAKNSSSRIAWRTGVPPAVIPASRASALLLVLNRSLLVLGLGSSSPLERDRAGAVLGLAVEALPHLRAFEVGGFRRDRARIGRRVA